MTPRRYRKDKRQAAVDHTRQRIVQATMELHNQQGVLATSFEDIARRADVAVATVYRHYPTLDDLVGACGRLTVETIQPPQPHNARELLAGLRSPTHRIARVAQEYAAFYERARLPFITVLRDRLAVKGLQDFLDQHHANLEAFVRAALAPEIAPGSAPPKPSAEAVALAMVLLDFPTWQGLVDRGVKRARVAEVLADLLACALKL